MRIAVSSHTQLQKLINDIKNNILISLYNILEQCKGTTYAHTHMYMYNYDY